MFLYPSALVEKCFEKTLLFSNNDPINLCQKNKPVIEKKKYKTGYSLIIEKLLFRSCKSVSFSKNFLEVISWPLVDGEADFDFVNFFCHKTD